MIHDANYSVTYKAATLPYTSICMDKYHYYDEDKGKKIGKKILNYLNESEGYVRIIGPLYGTLGSFEIKVPCMKKELIEEK